MREQFMIYLAGPISGITYGNCTEWREYVKENISEEISTLSPMRGKEFIKDRIGGNGQVGDHYDENALSTVKGINTRDYFDVQRADAIFVNLLEAEKVSIGTVMEIAWARAFNKPVVCCMEKDNIHNHGMLNYACGYIVDSLGEGINVMESLLLPDKKVYEYDNRS